MAARFSVWDGGRRTPWNAHILAIELLFWIDRLGTSPESKNGKSNQPKRIGTLLISISLPPGRRSVHRPRGAALNGGCGWRCGLAALRRDMEIFMGLAGISSAGFRTTGAGTDPTR